MSAFDKKIKRMPKDVYIIEDTSNNLFLISYSTDLLSCGWGNVLNAVHFDSQQAADDAISAWGETPGERFIGKVPPIHH